MKAEAARRQLDADAAARQQPAPGTVQPIATGVDGGGGQAPNGGQTTPGVQTPAAGTTSPSQPPRPRRFHGSAVVPSDRVGRDAGKIGEEVIAHLAGLVGANVKVTIEIEAEVPDGVPENVVRTVSENCRTLRFTSHGFEDS